MSQLTFAEAEFAIKKKENAAERSFLEKNGQAYPLEETGTATD